MAVPARLPEGAGTADGDDAPSSRRGRVLELRADEPARVDDDGSATPGVYAGLEDECVGGEIEALDRIPEQIDVNAQVTF